MSAILNHEQAWAHSLLALTPPANRNKFWEISKFEKVCQLSITFYPA